MTSAAYVALAAYRAACRVFKPYAGLTPLSFNRLTNALFAALPSSQRATIESGLGLEVNTDDYHGRILWLFGNNDFKVSRLCEGLVAADDVFLDIGANHGTIGFAVMSRMSARGVVHFFEPQPPLCEKIDGMIAQEASGRGYLHRVALFDRAGSFGMVLLDHHSGMATIAESVARHGDATITVETVEARDYVAPLVGDRPFGIKIDVEGAEPNILSRLVTLPNLLFVQFEGVNNSSELAEIFADNAFEVFGLEKRIFNGMLTKCRSLEQWSDFHDFLAVRHKFAPKAVRLSYFDLFDTMKKARQSRQIGSLPTADRTRARRSAK